MYSCKTFYVRELVVDWLSASKPDCPKAIIQWQHGTYKINDNGSLSLDPIKVDGRQLYSDPCANDHSIYTRYNQTEYYKVCITSNVALSGC